MSNLIHQVSIHLFYRRLNVICLEEQFKKAYSIIFHCTFKDNISVLLYCINPFQHDVQLLDCVLCSKVFFDQNVLITINLIATPLDRHKCLHLIIPTITKIY